MKHMISLSVGTNEPEETLAVYKLLSDIGGELMLTHEYASVYKTTTNELAGEPEIDEEPLYYDDHTLAKVHEALREGLSPCGLHYVDQIVTSLISEMQNAGIFFRERK